MKKLIIPIFMISLLVSTAAFASRVEVVPENATAAETAFLPVYFDFDYNQDGDFDDDKWPNDWRQENRFGTYAGQFKLTMFDANDSRLFETQGFCVDLNIGFGNGQFTYAGLDSVNNGVQLAWLFDAYGGVGKSREEYAALQLAIWDVLYTGPVLDSVIVDRSKYNYPSLENIHNYYDQYMAGLLATGGDYTTEGTYKIIQIDGRQDMIVRVVPEPGTMLLFGIGLLGIGAIGRKKF